MFGEIFYWVFNMSIVASLMGLIVMAIMKIRVIPKRISFFLWLVPFIRMCVPFGINNPYSLMSLISLFGTKTVTFYCVLNRIRFSFTNCARAAESYFPIVYEYNVLDDLFEILAAIWLIVVFTVIMTLGVLYFASLKEIKTARHLRDNIYLSEKVQSPAVYGIIKPKIILPVAYENADIKYILSHENMHIRHADNFWRLLAFLAASVHWFNPLAWVFLKRFLSDIELVCDENAIKNYNEEERKDDARTLLSCAENKTVFASAFGGAKLKTRINNILSYKNMTGVSAFSFMMIIVLIMLALLTNAA